MTSVSDRPDLTQTLDGQPIRLQRKGPGRYHLNGERVLSVTTILNEGVPKPALVDWAAKVTAQAAVNDWEDLSRLPVSDRLERLIAAHWETRDRAALTGTAIHALGEALVQGQSVDVPDVHRPAVEAYARFLDRYDVQPIAVERPVCHYAHGWAGQFDLRARVRGGTDWLFDLKTSRGIFDNNALQLAAYASAELVALDASGDLSVWAPPERCGFIHIKGDSVELRPLAEGAVEALYRAFRHAAEVARWGRQAKEESPIDGALELPQAG